MDKCNSKLVSEYLKVRKGGFICTFSPLITLSITLQTSKFRNQFTKMQSPPCDAVTVRSLVTFESLSISLRNPCQFDTKQKTLVANTNVTPNKQTNKETIKYLLGKTMSPPSDVVPI